MSQYRLGNRTIQKADLQNGGDARGRWAAVRDRSAGYVSDDVGLVFNEISTK